MKINCKQPIFFERNRVGRVYKGGKLFHDLFGDAPEDTHMPEEWIASSVAAYSEDGMATEGLSVIEGTGVTFDALLRQNREELLGDRQDLGILVKYLDSAIRLPVQAHPDKEFSKAYFGSPYGKTEAWLILGFRPGAKLYLGFNRQVSREEFSAAIEKSKTDKEIMAGFLREVSVSLGDVFLIPARCVHAVGYGCLILEVQEPTDFTVEPEYWCGDYPLTEHKMYMGLDKETALGVFDFSICGPDSEKRARKIPEQTAKTDDFICESLISYKDTPCFAINRYIVTGSFAVPRGPSVWIVVDGKGTLFGDEYNRQIKKGNYFFLSHASRIVSVKAEKKITLIECLPPKE